MIDIDSFVMIGEAPNQHYNRGDLPLYPLPPHMTGGRLCTMLGLHRHEYLRIDRRNLFPTWPGPRPPAGAAKRLAVEMKPSLYRKEVLFIGRGVANAFDLKDSPYLRWLTRVESIKNNDGLFVKSDQVYRFAILPHPSGRNRWWNDHDNSRRALAFMAELGDDLKLSLRCREDDAAP